jgi:malonate-semialdehyde dehydrogenase (acetylating)/methylmalonate-semialdehyde dehydrogenase
MPILQQGDKMVGCSQEIDAELIRAPLGVFAMIAPFNFPAMMPFCFLPYAIATGNTFVVKASKQVPLTMQLITEYIDQTGLPAGVYNLVNGDKVVADALMENPKVKGVSLVGSTAVCRQVAEKCARANKRFQAMGSAKNHLVAMPDARINEQGRGVWLRRQLSLSAKRCTRRYARNLLKSLRKLSWQIHSTRKLLMSKW